jgi:tetratricopeptide (TPR) repeat protein
LYNISGNHTLAKEFLRKSIELLEQNSEDGKSLNLANFHFMIVTQFENLLNFTETKSHLDSAIKALPEKEEYQGHLATFYLLLGANNAGEGNYLVAEKDFKQSLKIYRQLFPEDHPIHAFVLHYIATCKRSIGQYQKALEVQTEVLQVCKSFMQETDPDMAFPYSQMALIQYEMKNYKEALYFKEKARFVNDGSTDLSELDHFGQIKLIQYLKNNRTYYAYLIVLDEGQKKSYAIVNENLILAEQTKLDEALKLSQDITKKYGSFIIDL